MKNIIEAIKGLFVSRRIWGGIVLVVSALFGQDVGNAVNDVVSAVDAGAVSAIMVAVGALLIAASKLVPKKPPPPAE